MSGPYIFVDELSDIQVRDGMFFVTGPAGVQSRAFTPHMFLAYIQHASQAYKGWVDKRCEVIDYRKAAPAAKPRRRKAP